MLDDYGNPIYLSARRVKCRRVDAMEYRKKPLGDLLTSNVTYYTTEFITEMDKIDGQLVLEVRPYNPLNGHPIGYRSIV